MKTSKTALAVALGAAALAAAGQAAAQKQISQPDIGAEPTFGDVRISGGFTPDPYDVEIQAGGDIDASVIGPECVGNIAEAPDVDLYFSEPTSDPLYISVSSREDTTLAVNAPDGSWYCNDDAEGLNPGLTFSPAQDGLYNIYVGTYSSGDTPDATVHISEIGYGEDGTGGSGGSGSGPDFSLDPNYGEVALSAGFSPDPHTKEIAAGGEVDASVGTSFECSGWVSEAPDYRVNYTAGDTGLEFRAESSADTTLVVNAPDGEWYCDDDSAGDLNPRVRFRDPDNGQYDVWVGTFSSGDLEDATLYVSENVPRGK